MANKAKMLPRTAVTEYRIRDIPTTLWCRVKAKAAMTGKRNIGEYILSVLEQDTKGIGESK